MNGPFRTSEQVFMPEWEVTLIDADAAGFSIVARGELSDVAASMCVEGAADWRARRGLTVRTRSEAWPTPETRRARR